MGTKVTVSAVTNIDNSTGLAEINAALDLLANEFDKIVYRDDSTRNLTDDLDANSKRILNLPTPIDNSEPLRLGDTALYQTGEQGPQGEKGDPGAGSVDSVNGDLGPAVVLDADDIDDTSTTNKFVTAAQITKIDSVESSADVTDETNVKASLDGATTTSITPATGDKFLVLDASDSDNLKHVLGSSLWTLVASYATNSDVWTGTSTSTVINPAVNVSSSALVALSDGATITPDFKSGRNFSVTLGGNRTMANPTNQVAGQTGLIVVTQDGTGSRTLAWNANWKWAGGSDPTLSTGSGDVDIFSYYVAASGTVYVTVAGLDFA